MANWIHDIEIKNFKSIRQAEVEDCRRVNVFIGYPNVGKSNLLEALSLFSIDEENLDFSPFVRIKDLTTLFHDGNISNQAEVRVNIKHRMTVQFQNDVLAFRHEFERQGTSFEKKDSKVHYSDDSHDVSLRRRFQVQDKKAIREYRAESIGKANELPKIKKYEFDKRVVYSNMGYSSLSYPYGENIFNIISTNSNLKAEVAQLFKPNNLELLYDTRLQEFSILKRTDSGIFSIPYELVADTLQRIIFYKTAIKSSKESVLLFEEPEAHMFPPYVSKFTADVMYEDDNNQYFIATHSPFVINDFMENLKYEELSIYVVGYKKESGETEVRRLSEEELHEIYQYGIDLFLNVGNFLESE